MPDAIKKRKNSIFRILLPVLAVIIAAVIGLSNPQLSYLTIPFYVMFLAVLSAFVALALSPIFAINYVLIHKKIIILGKKSNTHYYIDKSFGKKESLHNFVVFNVWYSIGVTFMLLRFFAGDNLSEVELSAALIVLVSLALIFASGVNIAVYLIQKTGVFFQNKQDGSTTNLGNDLRRIINWALGPMQIIFFIVTISSVLDLGRFLQVLLVALIICFLTSIVSYLIIKRKGGGKRMLDRFSTKIDKIIKSKQEFN